jgi:hypothetical protein
MGALLLRACNVLGRPLDDEMDVFVVSPQTETTAASLRSARGHVSIRFEGLSEGQPYIVRLFPKRHRPVAQIVTAGPDAEPTVVQFHCPIHPDKVRVETFPQYAAVHPTLRQVLERSSVEGITGRGEAMYSALGKKQKAGLLNLFTKMNGVAFDDGRTPWSFVDQVFRVREDRVFVDVQRELFDFVHASVAARLFDRAPGKLHTPPPGFDLAASFKTVEPYGNLQLTFFSSQTPPLTFKVDADIDNAAGLGHAFQVIRNFVTQGTTDPYDIHQILVFRQQAALPYELA